MSGLSPGGIVQAMGEQVATIVEPAECLWTFRDNEWLCLRTDNAHHRQRVEAPRRLCYPHPRYEWGPCIHRHPVPVEAGGEVVAYLCPHCDQQLPADWRL